MRADTGVDCLHQAAFLSIFRHGYGANVQYEQISPFLSSSSRTSSNCLRQAAGSSHSQKEGVCEYTVTLPTPAGSGSEWLTAAWDEASGTLQSWVWSMCLCLRYSEGWGSMIPYAQEFQAGQISQQAPSPRQQPDVVGMPVIA